VADVLSFFELSSGSVNYAFAFLQLEACKEKHPLSFAAGVTEPCTSPFSLTELESDLLHTHDIYLGRDIIHNQVLKHLAYSTLVFLLKTYKQIRNEGCFPSKWGEVIIIPVSKVDKDQSLPSSCCPVWLICVCKVLERMVNSRLVWMLDSQVLLSDFHCGF
jgi:hypothetical protein